MSTTTTTTTWNHHMVLIYASLNDAESGSDHVTLNGTLVRKKMCK
jgi:hypothetical protein